MKSKSFPFVRLGACIYLALLLTWLLVYWLSGDQYRYVSLVNLLGVYFFFPLPIIFLLAPSLRRWEIWLGATLAASAFLYLWGALLLPRPGRTSSQGISLRVMTYNVLGYHPFSGPQVEIIQQENADIVFIQELNPQLAKALQGQLSKIYPYQVLDPQTGVSGMGVISKFPIRETGRSLPLHWIGNPQVLELDWGGTKITLVNFHMQSSTLATLDDIAVQNRLREAQAVQIASLAQETKPLIAAGDANATPLSDAARIFRQSLGDAWLEAGVGLGHTFPGSNIAGSSRPKIGAFDVPQWLLRIDYILHDASWQVNEAHTAQFDGLSDHRGVVATLNLISPTDIP